MTTTIRPESLIVTFSISLWEMTIFSAVTDTNGVPGWR